ncbi:MAG: hypothetical protein EP301_13295 [Gammaproteobacteria bacterium]|nr:MAG: hypothetical protein EP301_13295 [Gammaproteobacteria bacterium]
MALPTVDVKRDYGDSATERAKVLTEQFNLLATQFEALLAKLDADTGITDTDYESTLQSTLSTLNLI